MAVAFLFPGQGAQHVGMGRELYAWDAGARRAIDLASRACGLDLPRLCFDGPEARLAETEVTQPALLAVSAAALAALSARGVRADAAAGLSIGEYGALLAGGAIDLPEAAALVRRRGRYMQEAVPPGQGGMAAVLGLDARSAAALCDRVLDDLRATGGPGPSGGWVLSPANLNCPGQIVISGHAAAIERAAAVGREAGARRVQPLSVSGPFHCALMGPAEERLRPEVAALGVRDPAIPVVAGVTAEVVRTGAEAAAALADQVSRPVLWEAALRRLAALGCDTFVEVGAGRVLSGFVARTLPGARVLQAGDPQGVEACAAALAA